MALIWKKTIKEGIKLSNRSTNFRDLYTAQKRAVWFPEEINIWLDLADFHALSHSERTLFLELISYFVTSELLVQNVLWEAFYAYVNDPRAKMALTAQMFMESIHADFFEMILNTFGIDQDAMYSNAENNPIMRRKQDLVASAAQKISISNGGVDPDTLAWQKDILRAILVNNIVQEWIFFYSAFAMYFAVRETWKMKNVCNGIDLVLIDETQHLKMGIEMILTMIEDNPALIQDESFVDEIRQTIIDGTELELEFIQSLFGKVAIFNLSYNEMEQYVKYITDRRLQELWFDPYYAISTNPLKFLQKQDMKTLQNFFEVSANQYTNF